MIKDINYRLINLILNQLLMKWRNNIMIILILLILNY